MTATLETCALCPRLCRHACPVAVGTGREAATPTSLAAAAVDRDRGLLSEAFATEVLTLCVDCGACEAACHIGQPLPSLLRSARLAAREAVELPRFALPADDVLFVHREACPSEKLAARVGATPVVVPEGWSEYTVQSPAATDAVAWLVDSLSSRALWTQDGGLWSLLTQVGLVVQWAVAGEALPDGALASCACAVGGAEARSCCGAAEPLASHHPDDAELLGHRFVRGLHADAMVVDARCARHLRRVGSDAATLFDSPEDPAS